jgi:hypothetical protein
MAIAKPVILPETFTGDATWDEWIVHFNNCAAVNNWDDAAKLAFLKVRLTGRAQQSFLRLPADRRDTFAHAVTALTERFEPPTKRDLYVAELFSRKQKHTESWADYAEDLRRLSSKAYPDLDGVATA